MPFDSAECEEKVIRNLAIRKTVGNQLEDFEFTLGEGLVSRTEPWTIRLSL
jgi:hypothetical protein